MEVSNNDVVEFKPAVNVAIIGGQTAELIQDEDGNWVFPPGFPAPPETTDEGDSGSRV